MYVDTGRKKGYVPTNVLINFPSNPIIPGDKERAAADALSHSESDSFSDPELIEFDTPPILHKKMNEQAQNDPNLIKLANLQSHPNKGEAMRDHVKARFEFIGRSPEE